MMQLIKGDELAILDAVQGHHSCSQTHCQDLPIGSPHNGGDQRCGSICRRRRGQDVVIGDGVDSVGLVVAGAVAGAVAVAGARARVG